MTAPRTMERFRPADIITDMQAADVPPEFWTGGQNVAFRENEAQRVGGWLQIFNNRPQQPYHLQPIIIGSVAYWVYSAINNDIYATDGSSHANITPASMAISPPVFQDPWNSTVLNGLVIYNWGTTAPTAWDNNPSNIMTDIPGWPSNYKADVVRAFKNYLIAMAVEDAVGYDPNLIIWSDAAAPGNLPTSWTPAANNDAGFFSFADRPGPIIDGLQLRDEFIVYKRGATAKMNFVGGNNIFSLQTIFPTTGILGLNCVVAVRGRHFLFSDGDVVAHDGYQAQSIVNRRIRNQIFNTIDTTTFSRSFVSLYDSRKEIWFCYPENGNDFPNVAAVYNYEEGRWGFRELANTRHAAAGIVPSGSGGATEWDQQVGEWDSQTGSWSQSNTNAVEDALLMSDSVDGFLLVDGSPDKITVPMVGGLKRETLDFGEPQRMKTVTRVWPRIVGAGGTIEVRVGSQFDPYDAISWTPWITYDPNAASQQTGAPLDNGSVPLFATGRFISFEIRSTGGGAWRCTGFDVEFKWRGRY